MKHTAQHSKELGGVIAGGDFPYSSLDDVDRTSAYCFAGDAHGGPESYGILLTFCLAPSAYYNRIQILSHSPAEVVRIRLGLKTGEWNPWYIYRTSEHN